LGSPTDAEKIREHLFRIVDKEHQDSQYKIYWTVLKDTEIYRNRQTYNRPKNFIRERLETLEKEYEQQRIIAANIIEKKYN
jgi:hypothetical protein